MQHFFSENFLLFPMKSQGYSSDDLSVNVVSLKFFGDLFPHFWCPATQTTPNCYHRHKFASFLDVCAHLLRLSYVSQLTPTSKKTKAVRFGLEEMSVPPLTFNMLPNQHHRFLCFSRSPRFHPQKHFRCSFQLF